MVNLLQGKRSGTPASFGEKFFDILMVVITSILAFLMLYPVLYILKQSFSSSDTVGLATIGLIPKEWSLEGYSYVLKTRNIWTGYMNTIIRVFLSTTLGLLLAIGYAYPLSKKNLPFRGFFTTLIVITMFVGGGLIPRYLLIKNLNLMDSMWAMVLPGLAKAFNIIIMRNFFMSLPIELEEAAEIDGAGTVYILAKIILPVSKPILATLGLWIVVDNWNAWFDCMLYIKTPDLMVLQMILRKILLDTSNEIISVSELANMKVSQEVVKYATIIMATAPILMVYPFIQKYFVKGVMVGSLKG